MRTVSFMAGPTMTEPTERAIGVAIITCYLSAMSPTRPITGVKVDADGRYSVTNHVTAYGEVCMMLWMVVGTGIASDCNSAHAETPRTSTPKMTLSLARQRDEVTSLPGCGWTTSRAATPEGSSSWRPRGVGFGGEVNSESATLAD